MSNPTEAQHCGGCCDPSYYASRGCPGVERRSEVAQPCTCGSGGHPRECAKHPLAKELHCAEMSLDNVTAERDSLEKALEAAQLVNRGLATALNKRPACHPECSYCITWRDEHDGGGL